MRKVFLLPFAALLFATHAQARGGMPEPLTPTGQLIEDIYFKIFLIAVFFFLLVFFLLVFILWRYNERSGRGKATFEHERENLAAELTWTIIPLLVVTFVGFIAYQGLLAVEGDQAIESAEMEIQITASQYNWEADYGNGAKLFANPDGTTGAVADTNVFLVPENVTVLFNVTSVDVIHSWYIQDSNGGPVGMVDANPTGPAKYNKLAVTFPGGDYYVQCKEMCLNPGHAYMRARLKAVPMAEFNLWKECLSVKDGAAFIQDASIMIDGNGLQGEDLTVLSGGRVRFQAENMLGESVTLNVGEQSVSLDPGQVSCFGIDTPTDGEYTMRASTGGNLTITAITAKTVDVVLGDYFVSYPDNLVLEAGETYLFNMENVGTQPHNLFIGEYNNGQYTAQVESQTLGPGASGSVIVTLEQTMTFDWWCNVPGHVGLGMIGEVSTS